METIYYHLNATRVTVEGDRKVSGGEGVRCVVLPKKAVSPRAEGKVLDFEQYRRALQEKDVQAEAEAPEEEAVSPRRGLSPWLLVDLLASAAVVGFAALAAFGVLLG